jgi:hypothetical protein
MVQASTMITHWKVVLMLVSISLWLQGVVSYKTSIMFPSSRLFHQPIQPFPRLQMSQSESIPERRMNVLQLLRQLSSDPLNIKLDQERDRQQDTEDESQQTPNHDQEDDIKGLVKAIQNLDNGNMT